MTHAPIDRAANVTGAVALKLADRMQAAAAVAAGGPGRPGSETAAVAVTALYHFLDRPTVARLRQVLGLTSSGAVRMVDRLEQAGLVRRAPGEDGRTTIVTLTPTGAAAARRVAGARAAVLTDALAVLTEQERAIFERLIAKIAVGQIRDPSTSRWMCRLCDTGVCGVPDRTCPVTRAAWERLSADPERPKSAV